MWHKCGLRHWRLLNLFWGSQSQNNMHRYTWPLWALWACSNHHRCNNNEEETKEQLSTKVCWTSLGGGKGEEGSVCVLQEGKTERKPALTDWLHSPKSTEAVLSLRQSWEAEMQSHPPRLSGREPLLYHHCFPGSALQASWNREQRVGTNQRFSYAELLSHLCEHGINPIFTITLTRRSV